MRIKWSVLTRKTHYWVAAIVAAPLIVVVCSGLLLQLKKHVGWIQPPTCRGDTKTPELSFARILEIARTVPQAEIDTWDAVDRLDVQPGRGIVKVQAKNRWEIQLDHASGEIMQVAYRRSDVIEQIHDGTFFLDTAKLWVFLPTGLGLLFLSVSGTYLFVLPFWVRYRSRRGRMGPTRSIEAYVPDASGP